jgi:hypothetical protein
MPDAVSSQDAEGEEEIDLTFAVDLKQARTLGGGSETVRRTQCNIINSEKRCLFQQSMNQAARRPGPVEGTVTAS